MVAQLLLAKEPAIIVRRSRNRPTQAAREFPQAPPVEHGEHRPTGGREHTGDLAKSLLTILDELKAVDARHEIKRAVWKRETHDLTHDDESRHASLLTACPGSVGHLERTIKTPDFGVACEESLGG